MPRVITAQTVISFAAFLVGATAGLVYDSASWHYHLPYVGVNWLGRLLGADGERGYDAMLYESVIDFGLGFLSLYMLSRYVFLRVRSRSDHQKPRQHDSDCA
jgi:hypothetical protein